jgi:glycosyltransferase involved in cell wall biosynthesis
MGISACLITKNEETALARALKMISGYVDEIVVVDGQSEDGTAEVAEKFGAVVIRRKFSGSFAIERNSGIERARNDWVFILDPDETLAPEFLQTLRDLAASKKYDAYSFLRYDVLPDGTVLETPCGHRRSMFGSRRGTGYGTRRDTRESGGRRQDPFVPG